MSLAAKLRKGRKPRSYHFVGMGARLGTPANLRCDVLGHALSKAAVTKAAVTVVFLLHDITATGVGLVAWPFGNRASWVNLNCSVE